jgi:hypothetical protein
VPRRYHVDDAGRLRSGWPNEAKTEPEPDDEPTPPNIDAGAHSNRDRPKEIDMNQLIRDLSGHGSRWP